MRIEPVNCTTEYVPSKDFAEKAKEKAIKKLSPQKYDNLIELTYSNSDSLVDVQSLEIGTLAQIHNGGKVYNSILTGYEKSEDIVKLIFGIVRIDLTDKMALEKRSRNKGATYATAAQGRAADAALPHTGGMIEGNLNVNGALTVMGNDVWDSGNYDFEEGSWTPILFGSVSGQAICDRQYGVYRIIGNTVVAHFRVRMSSLSSLNGHLCLGGLPRSQSGGNPTSNTGSLVLTKGVTYANAVGMVIYYIPGESYVKFECQRANNGVLTMGGLVSNAHLADASEFRGVFIYAA